MGKRTYLVEKGDKFYRLTVETVHYIPSKKGETKIRCDFRCDCGKLLKSLETYRIVTGQKKSCGCLKNNGKHIEKLIERNTTHGYCTKKGNKPLEYMTWIRMRRRCENSECEDYERYGGRGIKVCDKWRESFESFFRDMGPRPDGKCSIDRIDNEGDYTPENCRWANITEQNRNKSDKRWLTIDGDSKGLTEWAEIVGINPETIRSRLSRGWTEKDAVFLPLKQIMERIGSRWKKRNMEVGDVSQDQT